MYRNENGIAIDLQSKELPSIPKFKVNVCRIFAWIFAIFTILFAILAIYFYVQHVKYPKLIDISDTFIMGVFMIISFVCFLIPTLVAKHVKKEYYKLRKEAMEKLGITDEAVDTSKSPKKFIIMNKYVRFAITIIASLSICIALLYNTGIDGDAFAWIALIVILISIGVVEYIHGRRVAAVNEEEAKHMVIDEENETAIMLQRSRISASFLSYETVHYMNYKNHSAKLVYTGATVGGIHTGGFHTTEAYTSESAGKSSDKAHVFVRYEGGKIVEIKKIKLTPELLAEAKKNKKISKFIVKDYINLRSKGQETKLTESEEYILSEAMKTNDTAMQYHITQRAFIAQFLHKDDIKNIVNWVSGDDYL